MFTAYLRDTAAARNMAPFHSNGATIGGQPTLTTRSSVKDVSNTLGPTEAHTTTDMPAFQRAQRATNLIHQQTCLTPSMGYRLHAHLGRANRKRWERKGPFKKRNMKTWKVIGQSICPSQSKQANQFSNQYYNLRQLVTAPSCFAKARLKS